jgi:uncharacterized protein (TIGR03905 family)
MSKHEFATKGICASRIDFEIDGKGLVRNTRFLGGCAGNTTAISSLVEGLTPKEVIKRLEGINCRGGTSCPDQLAQALKKVAQVK